MNARGDGSRPDEEPDDARSEADSERQEAADQRREREMAAAWAAGPEAAIAARAADMVKDKLLREPLRKMGFGFVVDSSPAARLAAVAGAVFMLVILAVIAAAAGTLLQETFGLPFWAGVAGIMLAVGLLAFAGTHLIQGVMAGWSVVLYAAYFVLFSWCLSRFGRETLGGFNTSVEGLGWASAGVRYAAYNVAIVNFETEGTNLFSDGGQRFRVSFDIVELDKRTP